MNVIGHCKSVRTDKRFFTIYIDINLLKSMNFLLYYKKITISSNHNAFIINSH